MKLVTRIEVIDGEEYERTDTELDASRTPRGFGLIEFLDRYGAKCSLQDSSLATEPAVWFGLDEVEVKVLDHVNGGGWKNVELPKDSPTQDVFVNGRMHLTQSMVKRLLPYLQRFAETGEYLTEMPPEPSLATKPITLKFVDDDRTEVFVGDEEVAVLTHDDLGFAGMRACKDLVLKLAEKFNLTVVEQG